MANDNKPISARTVAQMVLAKAQEILNKSETLKKYETENSPKPGVKYGSIETNQKATERDYSEYEVKPGKSKDSAGPRVAKQISPSGNPKEAAEGNNKPDGMEPPYEFKDKVKGELAKEKAALDKSEMKKKYEGFKAVEASAAKSGASDPAAVAAAAGMKKYGKKAFENAAHKGKKMGKAENPDKDADAKLGEKVEKDVEDHFKQNKEAEAKEGHKLMAKPMAKSDGKSKFGRCVEGVKQNSPEVTSPEAVCVAEGVKPEQQKAEGEQSSFIPGTQILSAKLAKFMERKHAKRKAGESAEAVGHEASDAPAPRSTQDGRPDVDKAETGHEKGVGTKPNPSFREGISGAGASVRTGDVGTARAHSVARMEQQSKIKPKLPR